MRPYVLYLALVAPLTLQGWCLAQGSGGAVNLLSDFDPKTQTVSGDWSLNSDEVRVAAGKGSRAVLASSLPLNYQVDVEFTRVTGSDVVAVILPVSSTAVSLELSSWNGEAHGLARVDEKTSRSPENPTSVRPGKLENGRRYQLSVRVSNDGENSKVEAELDGKRLIGWSGSTTKLKPHFVFNLPKQTSLGLTAHNSNVIFHQAILRNTSITAVPAKSVTTQDSDSPVRPVRSDDARLANLTKAQTPGWEPFNGARFTLAEDGDVVASIAEAGSGDRGAFLKGVNFTDGTIEVDLKGNGRPQQSFVGVVFHGIDGQTYESVYFRPFNFGTSDPVRRSHAVQYIAHPEWPWKRLRDERSGQFEKAVNPEPEPAEWFHARVDVAGDDVRVFVNNSERPSLQVKRLMKESSGKVGLWFNGIASFRNFSVTPENSGTRP